MDRRKACPIWQIRVKSQQIGRPSHRSIFRIRSGSTRLPPTLSSVFAVSHHLSVAAPRTACGWLLDVSPTISHKVDLARLRPLIVVSLVITTGLASAQNYNPRGLSCGRPPRGCMSINMLHRERNRSTSEYLGRLSCRNAVHLCGLTYKGSLEGHRQHGPHQAVEAVGCEEGGALARPPYAQTCESVPDKIGE